MAEAEAWSLEPCEPALVARRVQPAALVVRFQLELEVPILIEMAQLCSAAETGMSVAAQQISAAVHIRVRTCVPRFFLQRFRPFAMAAQHP